MAPTRWPRTRRRRPGSGWTRTGRRPTSSELLPRAVSAVPPTRRTPCGTVTAEIIVRATYRRSARMPADGTLPPAAPAPSGKAQHCPGPRRGLGSTALCIQCGKCVICHARTAVIRSKVLRPVPRLARRARRRSNPRRRWMPSSLPERRATHCRCAPEDCTGCGLCVEACPVVAPERRRSHKAINLWSPARR